MYHQPRRSDASCLDAVGREAIAKDAKRQRGAQHWYEKRSQRTPLRALSTPDVSSSAARQEVVHGVSSTERQKLVGMD